ncbi:hypothetical protein BJF78_21080 [Pseudonocardia sp. CNS-139]|nr:hypothetical protein BJF78_21080 [Pseudonocardia sp. CNS-139]
MPQIPTARRLQLGRELRRLREQAGITRNQVAEELDCDLTKVSRIETGKQGLSVAEVRHLLGMFGVAKAEADQIVEVAREAKKRSTHRVPDWLRAYVGYEAEAVEMWDFQIDLVPSLFQTEAYIRAITQAADPERDQAEVERLVAIRRERQARLVGDDRPRLHAVVYEAAIRAMVGGRDVMREQLERLLEIGALPTVTLQLLPFSAGAHAAMGSAFIILRLPGATGAQVVYTEDLWSGAYVEKLPQVSAYSVVFDRLSRTALDEQGTAVMLEEAVGELR